MLGPGYCLECRTPLAYDRYKTLITLVRDPSEGGEGLSLVAAIKEAGYDDLKVTEDIEKKFMTSKPRALSYLLNTPRPCCLTHIQNPSVGKATQIHLGVDKSGKPLTKLYEQWDTDVLLLMFGPSHPLLLERAEKEAKTRLEQKQSA